MIKKTSLKKKTKFIVSRWAERYGLLKTMQSISREKYAEKVSASLFYGLLSAIAVNFFFQPGHVYSSGATGFAQVLSAISERLIGFRLPISVVFYAINVPLLVLAWYKIGHKFTVFTLITVSMSSFFIQIVPEIPTWRNVRRETPDTFLWPLCGILPNFYPVFVQWRKMPWIGEGSDLRH